MARLTVVCSATPPHLLKKSAFFGRFLPWSGIRSGAVLPVPSWSVFGACFGCPCLLSRRDKHPTPISGGLFGGRCYPTLPRANFFCLGEKGGVDKGAKGGFFCGKGLTKGAGVCYNCDTTRGESDCLD